MILSLTDMRKKNQQSGLPLTFFDHQKLGKSGPPLTQMLWKNESAEETQLRMGQENQSGQLFKNKRSKFD